MKIGTKSILFGVHCFFIHPIFVLIAWIKLYGFPYDPRIWIAIFIHDLGYWGKSNIDGQEGKTHPLLGAKIIGIFGKKWYNFIKYHSRYYSIEDKVNPSKLCYADKLSICYEWKWLYLLRANLTKEIYEFLKNCNITNQNIWFFYINLKSKYYVAHRVCGRIK